ncbi:type 1 glutamine amidotransferase domain-containing protein [Shewanella waksmanii]|uniref:type 1 glutamine amidotransferase domain-containing protein n=1 Tax=Shewanella waksmanii TaxID=213783 RepID=UPI003736155F
MNLYHQITKLICLLLTLLSFTPQAYAGNDTKRVLMVLSGYGQQQGKLTPGYEFDEFAKAYLIFKDNQLLIDIASPQGGKVSADEYDPNKPYNAEVLADAVAMKQLNNTLATGSLKASEYDGVFIVGGKGAMFDLPKDKALQTLIKDIYQQQGSVAAVCHGPAALVDVKLDNGDYLIAGKAINGFTNQEEQLFGKKWLKEFEFMLQDKLSERGGKFQSSPLMLSHVAVDERLITGQNPTSTTGVATQLVKQLGIKPAKPRSYDEDITLVTIAQYLAGDEQQLSALSQQTSQLPLVGMYGFYYQKIASSAAEQQHALALMTLAQQAINNPVLDMQIAQTQHQLGLKDEAKSTLTQLLSAKPDYQPALDMLQKHY